MASKGFRKFVRAFLGLGADRLVSMARDKFGPINTDDLTDEQLDILAGLLQEMWDRPDSAVKVCPLCKQSFLPGCGDVLCGQCFIRVLGADPELTYCDTPILGSCSICGKVGPLGVTGPGKPLCRSCFESLGSGSGRAP